MKSKILLLTIITILIMPFSAEAQVKTWIKKKAKRATKTATKTADKEVDKEIDKQVTKGVLNLKDKLLGAGADSTGTDSTGTVYPAGHNASDRSPSQSQSGLGALSAIMGGGGDVKHKGSYNFDLSINMEMEIYDEASEEASMIMDYVTYINTSNTDVAIDIKPQSEGSAYQGNMTMIWDTENNSVFILTNQSGQKMAIASAIDEMPIQDTQAYDYEVSESSEFTKTGKTRTISGYKCEGYTMQDGESRVDMWVTRDIDFYTGKEQMKKAGIPMYHEGPFDGGMLMETEVFENNIRQMKMLVTGINKNMSQSFSMSGYTIMNMNMGEK